MKINGIESCSLDCNAVYQIRHHSLSSQLTDFQTSGHFPSKGFGPLQVKSLCNFTASLGKLLFLITINIHSWHIVLFSTVFGEKKLRMMNLLVTFSVNFPQQEECLNSLGQHTPSRHEKQLQTLPFRLASFIKIGGFRLPPDMHWPRKGK